MDLSSILTGAGDLFDSVSPLVGDIMNTGTANKNNATDQANFQKLLDIAQGRYDTARGDSLASNKEVNDYTREQNKFHQDDVTGQRGITDALLQRIMSQMDGASGKMDDATGRMNSSYDTMLKMMNENAGSTDANGNQTYFDPKSNQWITQLSTGQKRIASAQEADEAQRLQSRGDAMQRQGEDAESVAPDLARYSEEMRQGAPSSALIAALTRRSSELANADSFKEARNTAATELSRTGGDVSGVYSKLAKAQASQSAQDAVASELAGLQGHEQLLDAKSQRLSPIINSLAARRTAMPTLDANGFSATSAADASNARTTQTALQRGSLGSNVGGVGSSMGGVGASMGGVGAQMGSVGINALKNRYIEQPTSTPLQQIGQGYVGTQLPTQQPKSAEQGYGSTVAAAGKTGGGFGDILKTGASLLGFFS